ncbi:MAG: butyrate kinase [Bacteroidales bacterium]|jgi:butyrate kinase
MTDFNILAINPGSTSTKIACFVNEKCYFETNIKHSAEELSEFKSITDQFHFRKEIIIKVLLENKIDLNSFDLIMGRGGLVKPIPSGVYEVNDALINDLKYNTTKEHASNLGGLIAADIAESLPKAKAYITDPVVVDELQDVARYSGHPAFKRTSIFHALNHKAIARQYAKSIDKKYEDLNLIVIHMGGGVSVGAHCKGKVIDVNQTLDGEGPFSPERSGTLPSGDLVRLCYSGKYTESEVLKMVVGKGGMVAYLGTNSVIDIAKRAEDGDEEAKNVILAFAYQIAKYIGMMASVLYFDVDAILFTGGIAHNKHIIQLIKERVEKIAPIFVYPGEDEMNALAGNGLLVLRKEIEPVVYS